VNVFVVVRGRVAFDTQNWDSRYRKDGDKVVDDDDVVLRNFYLVQARYFEPKVMKEKCVVLLFMEQIVASWKRGDCMSWFRIISNENYSHIVQKYVSTIPHLITIKNKDDELAINNTSENNSKVVLIIKRSIPMI
jgi:hypothetical protein